MWIFLVGCFSGTELSCLSSGVPPPPNFILTALSVAVVTSVVMAMTALAVLMTVKASPRVFYYHAVKPLAFSSRSPP